jgi:hypothetical protein
MGEPKTPCDRNGNEILPEVPECLGCIAVRCADDPDYALTCPCRLVKRPEGEADTWVF